MNAAEHVIQSFFARAHNPEKKLCGDYYLTLANVVCRKNHEVDILAVSGDGEDRLRVESEVAVNWYLEPKYILKRAADKLLDPCTDDVIREKIFAGKPYRKVFVVWKCPFKQDGCGLPEELEAEWVRLRTEGIEVWSLVDLIQDLLGTVGQSNYQDEVLRVMSMVSAMQSVSGALRECGCPRVAWDVNEVGAKQCVDAVARLAAKKAAAQGRRTVQRVHVEAAIESIGDSAMNSVRG